MKKPYFFVIIVAVLSLSSCIEIVDDISLNDDGSGSFKYSINLSSSKVKISSLLALDSLDGKKIPSREEIQQKINHFMGVFESKEGVSNVTVTSDFENYIFKLKCEFKSVSLLQEAIKSTVRTEIKENNDLLDEKTNWLTWKSSSFDRSVPDFTIKKAKELSNDEVNLLKEGNYISITRFQHPVRDFSNESAILAKNKLAVMLKTNMYSLTQNPNLLENTIYLSPLKQ
jgi:hypothetical protein